jgi:ubiquinone/menaquinone biosynthesis C-methylase UbiE
MKLVVIVVAAVGLGAVSAIVWKFGFFAAPYSWTREPARLAALLGVGPGHRVADIGAGDGSMALEMARIVGPSGTVFASELTPEKRALIEARRREPGGQPIRVVTGAPDHTRLPAGCCDAVYLRAVFHHIEQQSLFARDIAAAVRPGGRIAIVDFAPGSLWFHGADHGVTPVAVTAAFAGTACRPLRHIDQWGGGMFLQLFEC